MFGFVRRWLPRITMALRVEMRVAGLRTGNCDCQHGQSTLKDELTAPYLQQCWSLDEACCEQPDERTCSRNMQPVPRMYSDEEIKSACTLGSRRMDPRSKCDRLSADW